jgi:hypothetical protein
MHYWAFSHFHHGAYVKDVQRQNKWKLLVWEFWFNSYDAFFLFLLSSCELVGLFCPVSFFLYYFFGCILYAFNRCPESTSINEISTQTELDICKKRGFLKNKRRNSSI